MAKTTKPIDPSPLSHFWTPPAGVVEGGPGKPWACLSTTFEFDAAFFETELLPRFLGLKFDQTENEPSFLVEREEALELARVCTLVDHSRFDSSQTTLRWDQVQIQIPAGIQHAKITILAWEKLVRVIIGSANLTQTGYRRNREIFAALDFCNHPDSTPRRLLREALDLVTVMLKWSRWPDPSVNRAQETIASIRGDVRRWNDAPLDFTARQRPRATLVATHPAGHGHSARSTLDEVIALWGNRRATSVVVVSPFAAPEPDSETGDAVVNKLAGMPMSRECEGWLIGPELPRTPEDDRTRLPFPPALGESWKTLFDKRGGAYVLPIPLCVEGKEDRNRALHSKCVFVENDNDDVALMMIGSSNFTPRGMGIRHHNFEANLVFEDAATANRGGLQLIGRLGLPRDWDEAQTVDDVVWQSPEGPGDGPDQRPALPGFFAFATFSQVNGELKLGIDRGCQPPKAWFVSLPGNAADVPKLFTHNLQPDDQATATLSKVLPDAMRAANIVALLVQWQDEHDEPQHAKLGVTVESESDLLPPEQFQKLNADAIIECLISGKTPSQWVGRKKRKGKPSGGDDAAIDSLRSVETSSFLLYRVRRFGRALTGMGQRILRTISIPDAIRYRLLKDPFGPISLAQSITRADEDDTGWWANLDQEHRLFLLAEIELTVIHLRARISRKHRGKDRQAIDDVFALAIQQLRQFSEDIIPEGSLPDNLRDYLARVKSLAQPAGDAEEVKNVR